MIQRHLLFIIIVFILALPFIYLKLRVTFAQKPWLLKKQIQHKKFGKLWYIKDKKAENSHYQGYIYFAPENIKVSIFFYSKTEFDEKQTLFFEEIEKKYSKIHNENIKILENKFKTNLDDLFLDSIFISKSSNLNQLWPLTYYSIKNNLLNITINYQGWDIQNIK